MNGISLDVEGMRFMASPGPDRMDGNGFGIPPNMYGTSSLEVKGMRFMASQGPDRMDGGVWDTPEHVRNHSGR